MTTAGATTVGRVEFGRRSRATLDVAAAVILFKLKRKDARKSCLTAHYAVRMWSRSTFPSPTAEQHATVPTLRTELAGVKDELQALGSIPGTERTAAG